jgi:uncharacterized membrane protein YdbT with pleckstrin-like domain
MSEEKIVFRGSPSVLTRFGALFLCFLVFAAAVAFMFVVPDGGWRYGLGTLAGIALVNMLIVILLVKATQYEVTSERIRVRKGIFTKRTDELELYRVNDTSLIEPFTMRMFGLGTVEIRTMDTTNPRLYIEAVHGARKLREDLRRCVEECRDRKGVRVTEFENPPPSAS